ncbi:MAG: acylneuraminate cytidylyltransferase family protein [Candidatus Gorgyraea atricola]|nr:acylneuraminate cytidylyltransferase family protein [Candidatus Gorgyraea atricola]
MIQGKKVLSLISARGGSKRLPGKNIRDIAGKPLIAWTIEQAKNSKYIDRVIVSTDDRKISEVATRYGADMPFLRPWELAKDDSKGIDVAVHAIEWMEKNNTPYDLLILLQPTSPLRRSVDIDKAIESIFLKNASAIVSVCETEHHPFWANILPENGCMKNFLDKRIVNKNRQELPLFYRLNGAIYIAYADYIKSHKTFFGNKTYAYIMPTERSVDIDSEIDIKFAEFLLYDKYFTKKGTND